jgi:hypothetical protein
MHHGASPLRLVHMLVPAILGAYIGHRMAKFRHFQGESPMLPSSVVCAKFALSPRSLRGLSWRAVSRIRLLMESCPGRQASMVAEHAMSRGASLKLGAKTGEQGVGEQPQRAIAGGFS